MPSRSSRTPFIGRERELAFLVDRLRATESDQGSIVFVVGEPGIGKTRLLQEFVARARCAGWHTAFGRGYQSENSPPYVPFAEALRELTRDCSPGVLSVLLGESGPEVTLLLPALPGPLPGRLPPTDVRSGVERSDAQAAWERQRFLESVSDFLIRIIRRVEDDRRGLLLCFDDLQWADASSLLLLRHLAYRIADAPIVIAGAYRDLPPDRGPALADLLADLRRERLAEILPLRPFSRDETDVLVAEVAGVRAEPKVLDAIYQGTDGNPFFVEEVVRQLLADGRNLLDPMVGDAPWHTPDGARQVVEQRIRRLSQAAQRMLIGGAVIGDGFPFDVVAALSEIDFGTLLDLLDEALGAGLIREEHGLYRFTHALIRHCILEGMNRARRILLHQRTAETLERLYAADLEPHLAAIAYHWGQVASPESADRAADYACRAGDRAVQVLAYEEAVRLYRLALAARDLRPDLGQRLDLLLRLGSAHRRAGALAESLATFWEAAEAAQRLLVRDDGKAAVLLARAALGYENALLLAGLPRHPTNDPSTNLLGRALRTLPVEEVPLRATLLAGLARAIYFGGQAERGLALSGEAVELARQADDATALAYVLNARRTIVSGPDDLDQRLAVATELIQVAEAVEDPELAIEGHLWRLRALLERGDLASVDDEVGAYARLARASRQPSYLAFVATLRALRALIDGRFVEVEPLARQALSLGRKAQSKEADFWYVSQLIWLRRDVGPAEALADLVRAASAIAGQFPDNLAWWAHLALFDAELGRHDAARSTLDRLARNRFAGLTRDWRWLTGMACLAESTALVGVIAHAAVLYPTLLPYAAWNVSLSGCHGSAARYLGLLAETLDRPDDARQHYQAAIAFNDRMGALPQVAHTKADYARLLRSTGRPSDRARAATLAAEASDLARRLGMSRLVARIAPLCPGSEPPPRRRSTLPPDGLTAREVEILRLVGAGKSNQDIADALVISLRTVERHISNLYAKIGARGKVARVAAAAYAISRGIVVPS